MKRAIATIAVGLAATLMASAASAQATLNNVKQKGFLTCGSNTGLAGFGVPDAQGNWTGLDVDLCRAHRGGDLQRSDQGALHPALGEGPLHGAAVGRGRRARPQHHLDDVARHPARPRFHRRQLLRRPGLHGPQEARRRLGEGALRRLGLHPAGHHDRAQPRRLLPRQQPEVRGRRLRDRGRDLQGLRLRPLRRLHDGRLGPLFGAPQGGEPRTSTSSCPRSSPRSRSARPSATATTSGATSCAGPTTP